MGNSDDFAWPPLESEIDGLEIVDVDTGSARSVRGVEPPPPTEREPTTVIRAARHTSYDFTWPPVEHPRDAIVPLDATLDAGSPWAPVADRDSLGDAETLISHAPRRRQARREWTRWAAAFLLCAAGGALLERQVRIGLQRLADGDLARSTTVESRAAARAEARHYDAGRVPMVGARDATFADVRLPRGLGDVGISRPLPAAERPPAIVRTAAVVGRPVAPQTTPSASPAASAPPPMLVASSTSLSPTALAFGAAPRPTIAPAIETRPAVEEARIEATLDRYRTAYASLDAAAARSVWPSVDARALERAFGSLKSQGLDFEGCKTDVQGPEATVACHGRTTYVPRIGSQRPRTEEHQWRFKLRKVDESWLIVTADAS